jgi:LuxR family maltose regulon positive regulatory protein
MGDGAHAQAAVVAAVVLAAEHELLRPLVAAGQDLHGLLAACAGRFGRYEDFAARVHAAVASTDQEGMEALTRRELQLLVELPSPRTADEIAASMFVSVNTVKTHLRGIYRKLGVNSRREAIVLARRRGLL